jgi:hypothetical protein
VTDVNDRDPRWLQDAGRVLRDAPPPNDLWRQRLLREIAASPVPARDRDAGGGRRVWSVRPMTAAAAGLVCALIGASATALVLRDNGSSTTTARATALPAPSLDSVRFTLVAPNATRVTLVGDFNGWDPVALPLRRAGDGRTWEIEVPLAPGRYAYSFLVDGALARDPLAPRAAGDDFGSPSSVVMVRATAPRGT